MFHHVVYVHHLSLPLPESHPSSGLPRGAHLHAPCILNTTRHGGSSKFPFKEIYLAPKDTKNPSFTFRKHFTNNFSPWGQTVSPRKPRNVESPLLSVRRWGPSCLLDHTPAFIISLWVLGNREPSILLFQMDSMQSTLAPKASGLCFITNN